MNGFGFGILSGTFLFCFCVFLICANNNQEKYERTAIQTGYPAMIIAVILFGIMMAVLTHSPKETAEAAVEHPATAQDVPAKEQASSR